MLLLTATTDKLQLVTSVAADVDVHVSYLDHSSGTVTPGRQNTAITTAATTDIVSAPGASTQRNVKMLQVRNKDSADATGVTVVYNQNGTSYELHKVTLSPGEALEYADGVGFLELQTIAAPEALTAARTYYVRTDGSDSNDGRTNTSGGAFLTMQKAVDVVSGIFLNGYDVTIQVGDGTYTAGVSVVQPWLGKGTVTVVGNTGTPANVIVSVTSNHGFSVQHGRLAVDSLEIRTTTAGSLMRSIFGGYLKVSSIRCGTCAADQMLASGGQIEATGNYSIVGGASSHWNTANNGLISVSSRTITLTGTPNFTTSFAYAQLGGVMTVASNTFSGSATGTRYSSNNNGVINTGGGGASYIPGNVAGSTATGGQYV